MGHALRRGAIAFLAGMLLVSGPGLARLGAEEDAEAFQKRVNAAIDRGVAWLRTQQQKDGSFPGLSEDRTDNRAYNLMDLGLNALVILTMAHGGADADDDAVKKNLRFIEGHYRGDPRKGSWNWRGTASSPSTWRPP